MKLRFFGRLRDYAGTGERDVVLPKGVETVGAVRQWLGTDLPDLLQPTVRIALDDRLTVADEPVGEALEISFLPPVSGG